MDYWLRKLYDYLPTMTANCVNSKMTLPDYKFHLMRSPAGPWFKMQTILLAIGIRIVMTLQWRHNKCDGFSNHQPHSCLLNRLFRHRSKKTSKLCVTGLCAGNSPHKWPVTWKMFPFDDVIMIKWSQDCLIFIMQVPVLLRQHIVLKWDPCALAFKIHTYATHCIMAFSSSVIKL